MSPAPSELSARLEFGRGKVASAVLEPMTTLEPQTMIRWNASSARSAWHSAGTVSTMPGYPRGQFRNGFPSYRREISPITTNRPAEDQQELAHGVLKQDASGKWVWKMDPVYIEQRVKRGAPVRPALWPVLERLQFPTLVIWGTESDVLSEDQAGRMAQTLPSGELVSVPGVGHAPILTEPAALAAIEQVLGR